MDSAYRFSAQLDDMDREQVHRWLSEQSYWAQGRPRRTQDAAMDSSRNYGVFDRATGRQVAYARVVTDAVTFAWLCDVFVDPAVRGQGVGKDLIAGVIADLEPLGLRRVLLATADAHGLYEQYGFGPLDDPSRFMVKA
ncbi:GNAT family N-acetyltransferase [Arthrobacter woluwensis]|uniref:Acetyltransferase (GNAT) family protein n=1 Tax=Arthrobacter woluwensis TaxID=156980 RepID=A0A1H4LUJ7_9MICC|nr:GNAT family N-acetyltransferase [Arthrobacter woluwensis]SEB74500.1 Acetyltransferase (GNAT) family protein [Arthrobacter woluwensis]